MQILLHSFPLICCAVFLAGTGECAEPVPPEFVGPTILQRAGNMASWSVRTKAKGGKMRNGTPAEKRNPVSAEESFKERIVVKTNDLIRSITTGWDGKVTEEWVVNFVTLRRDPVTRKILILDPRMTNFAPRFDLSDFQGLSWIEPQYFVKADAKGTEKCLLFEWKERMPSGEERAQMKTQQEMQAAIGFFAGKPSLPTKVWINAETRLPVVSEDETATCTYKFEAPPSAPLTLPSDFQAAWDEHQKVSTAADVHQMPRQE